MLNSKKYNIKIADTIQTNEDTEPFTFTSFSRHSHPEQHTGAIRVKCLAQGHRLFSPSQLGDLNQQPCGYKPNTFNHSVTLLAKIFLSHTPDRCTEMCCFTGSAIVVWHPWSTLGLSTLLKGTSTDFHLVGSVFQPATFRLLTQRYNH